MSRRLLLTLLIVAVLVPALATAANPRVKMETSKGVIILELYQDKAPLTVANFLEYVKDGHYDATMLHRVIAGFMIQGGGFDYSRAGERKATRAPIPNEAGNKLRNLRGTVAMARTGDPNSATDQFFINLKDNGFLDYKNNTVEGIGYCVFAKVVQGMEVVDAIAKVPVQQGRLSEAVPLDPVVIKSVTLVEAK